MAATVAETEPWPGNNVPILDGAKIASSQFHIVDGAKIASNPEFHRGAFAGLLHLYRGMKPMRIAQPSSALLPFTRTWRP